MVLIGAAIKSVLRFLSRTSAGDRDAKWSVHYSSQKPQQGLSFVAGKRRSGSAEDLRAYNGLTQHGCSQPQPPAFCPFPGPDQSEGGARRRWRDKSRRMRTRVLDFFSRSCFSVCFKFSVWRRKSSAASEEDEAFFLNNTRPMTPLILNPVGLTSSWDGFSPADELAPDAELEPVQRLPTPEERMRQQAEAVAADLVPINITGESFDRQASFRRTLSNGESLTRRPRKLGRRQTVSSIPEAVLPKSPLSADLPGQFSTVGRPAACPPPQADRREGPSPARRIRAPRGEGMSSLMASLTSSPGPDTPPGPEKPPLPRLDTSSSLTSEGSCTGAPYRTLSDRSSTRQGFPSDLHLLLPSDHVNGVRPPPPHLVSSPSLENPWKSPGKASDSPQHEAPSSPKSLCSSSSSSMTHSEFSYQALDDARCFSAGGPWSYTPPSPSPSVHGGWSPDPLLSSGRSTPSGSLCSEGLTDPPHLPRDRRRSSSSSYCSRISLRKSKRPPPPPARSDSLRRRPGRGKPPRASPIPHLERPPPLASSLRRPLGPPEQRAAAGRPDLWDRLHL